VGRHGVTIRQPLRARLAPRARVGFWVSWALVSGNATAALVPGVIGVLGAWILFRMRVRVNVDGVTVVNFLRRQTIQWLDLVDVSLGFGDRFASGRCLIFHRRTGPPICSWAVSEGGLVRLGYGVDRIEQIAAQIDRYRQDLPFATGSTSFE
jgi:hypothetical protein